MKRKKRKNLRKLILKYGMIDGEHHKQWLLDQVLQGLLGKKKYHIWIEKFNTSEDHSNWDVGTAP